MKTFIALLLTLILVHSGYSQSSLNKSENYLKSVASKVDGNWAWFNTTSQLNVNPDNYFLLFKKSLGLTDLDSMHFERKHTDGFDFLIYRYKQFHKGIPVENAEYVLEVRNGQVEVAHGHLAENINLNLAYSIDEAQAFEKAKRASGFSKFAWEIDSLQTLIKELKNDKNATWLSRAEIMFANLNPIGIQKQDYRLSYQFEIMGSRQERVPAYDIYVDAITGAVLKKIPKTMDCFSPEVRASTSTKSNIALEANINMLKSLASGTGTCTPYFSSRYGNPVSFTDDVLFTNNGIQLELKDTQKGLLQTRYWATPSNPITILNGSGAWNSNFQDATTVHWAVEKSYDYFSPLRQGMSGNNNSITAYVKWNEVNSQYYNSSGLDFIRCGQLSGGGDIISLDILGHEYTHGLTRYTANLLYQGFAGALNESFSDMLGTMVERSVLGGGYNLLVGEDVFSTGLRDMQNPNNHLQPASVGGTYWLDPVGCNPDCNNQSPTYNDCCYVHINSGVPNRWFAIVANSPVGSPEPENAGFIAYATLVRLTSYSDFNDARNASIDVATYYYGQNPCNNKARDVTNAWAAVGVGNPSTCPARIAATENSTNLINEGYPLAYPNPVSDELKVQLKNTVAQSAERIFSLYNVQGKKMIEVSSRGNEASIDVKQLPNGFYILNASLNDSGKTKLIMKQQVIVNH